MKIVFVINSLELGGAERVVSHLAESLAQRGNQVSIITFAEPSAQQFFQPEASVQLRALGFSTRGKSLPGKVLAIPRILRILRKEITKQAPDLVISFMDQANILCCLALLGSKTPLAISERVHPEYSSIMQWFTAPLLKLATRLARNIIYRRAQTIIVQTDDARAAFPAALEPRIVIIPNAVYQPANSLSDLKIPPLSIVGMGRLTRQKRFDLLIEAFSRVHAEFPAWSLSIIGTGEDADALKRQIDLLKLGESVKLLGTTTTPRACLAQASIFVLSSDYEGFPGALAEAMAAGVACISTNCPAGPSTLIEHERNGLMVPPGDVAALSEALKRVMKDAPLRIKLAQEAQRVKDRFSEQLITKSWLDLCAEIIDGKFR